MYRIPDDVLSAALQGETVLLHAGSKDYFRLNETAAVVWSGLERGLGRDDLLERLTSEFDVDAATARRELDTLLAELIARDLIRPAT